MKREYLVNKVIDGIRVKVYFNDKVYTEEEQRERIARFLVALTDGDYSETA